MSIFNSAVLGSGSSGSDIVPWSSIDFGNVYTSSNSSSFTKSRTFTGKGVIFWELRSQCDTTARFVVDETKTYDFMTRSNSSICQNSEFYNDNQTFNSYTVVNHNLPPIPFETSLTVSVQAYSSNSGNSVYCGVYYSVCYLD